MRRLRLRASAASVGAAGALSVGIVATALAAPKPPSPDWERDVLPILQARCLKCHGGSAQLGKLDLRTFAALAQGGAGGHVVTRGKPEASPLYLRVADRTMPPGSEKKLTDAEIGVIRAWIAAGAAAPARSGKDAARPAAGGPHWAFVSPKLPPVPQVRRKAWVRNPIDAFTLARLETAGLRPPRTADRRTLLRRVYLDLIGLPPTPAEVGAFLADTAPAAYERVVDDLLGRPQYGERWARKWLDVARYAESNGYERDGAKPNAWRYRDYVIDSLNRDKPFDRFLIEQLAGDELPGTNAETQAATTFLRLGTWDDEPAEPELDRYDQLDDILGTTTAAFLGITLRCARCHDHKFEPFSQMEYYQVLSVFQPLKRPQDGRRDLDRLLGTPEELKAYQASAAEFEGRLAALRAELERLRQPLVERIFAAGRTALPADAIAAFRAETARRTPPQAELVKKHEATLNREILAGAGEQREPLEKLLQQLAAMEKSRPAEPPRGYVWYEETPQAPPTRLLVRGEPHQPGEEVQPGVPAVLAAAPDAPPQSTDRSSGRRLWLARWMARPEHPLTARVIVNRIWQGHFGEGLVATENDFGVMGRLPSHPELLDYLAVVFATGAGEVARPAPSGGTAGSQYALRTPQHAASATRQPVGAAHSGLGWRLKKLHRLIVTSNTYKAADDWDPAAAKKDPDDALFWRWRPRRLDAEAVRDSILAVTGRLNPQMGGPSVYPTISRAVLAGQSRPGDGWGKSGERQAARRSVYIFSKRSLVVPELEILDAPDTTSSCEQRPVSTIAPQALTFLNGEFIQQQAAHFAGRLLKEAGADANGQVELAFQLAFSRPPTPVERDALERFLKDQEAQIKSDLQKAGQPADKAGRQALEALCLVLLNANEFVYQR